MSKEKTSHEVMEEGNITPEDVAQGVAPESTEETKEVSEADRAREAIKAANDTSGEVEQESAQEAAGTEVKEAQTAQEVEFQPNYHYKVLDKEHEIPEFLRGTIKDEETQKQVKELFEKAGGLDHIKSKYNELESTQNTLVSENAQYKQAVDELRSTYQRNDFDGLFKQLQIDENKVLQWVLDKAQYNEMAPEQRQQIDARFH